MCVLSARDLTPLVSAPHREAMPPLPMHRRPTLPLRGPLTVSQQETSPLHSMVKSPWMLRRLHNNIYKEGGTFGHSFASAPCNLQAAPCNLQAATCNLQAVPYNLPPMAGRSLPAPSPTTSKPSELAPNHPKLSPN